MKLRYVLAALSLGLFAGPAMSQNAPVLQQTEFKPGLDDAMTMMVQPRHVKLHGAVDAKNWELAAFELDELRASFRRIGTYIPVYRTKNFPEAVTGMMGPGLDAVAAAIKVKDAKAFKTAFIDLTNACNACHTYMDHPFLVMKVPTNGAALYPDQEFKSAKQ